MTAAEFNSQLVDLEAPLARFALKLTSNRDDAKDLLQDTFLKALTYQEHFEQSTNLQAWTFTIMKNTFINNYRRQARHNTVFDDTKDLFFLSQNRDTFNADPDATLCEKEIDCAISRLDSEFRVPLKMYTQGYKYKEISRIMGMKIGTVKSRIHFSRKKLSKTLEGY
jgi:RNA polymerase sigma-70 factor (ECF subfamily)